MDGFQYVANLAIKSHMKDRGLSADHMAAKLGITRSAFYSKLCGRRPWKQKELRALAFAGVKLPPLDTEIGAKRASK